MPQCGFLDYHLFADYSVVKVVVKPILVDKGTAAAKQRAPRLQGYVVSFCYTLMRWTFSFSPPLLLYYPHLHIFEKMDNAKRSLFARHFERRRLVWYTLFYGSHIALFSFGWWKQASDIRLAGLNTLKFSVWFSRGG